MLNNLSISKKLYLGFGIVLVILITLSSVTFINFSKFVTANGWDKHTFQVLSELQSTTGSMVNMETGQRGYAITGDEKFLEPYNQGKADFATHFNKVKELTSDNPKQQELLNQVQTLEKSWVAIAENSINQRRDVANGEGKMEDIIRMEQAAEGKKYMDNLRETIQQSENIESSLMQQRSQVSASLQSLTDSVIIIGTILAVIMAVLMAFFVSKSIVVKIKKLILAAESISSGNMNVDLDTEAKDETGVLSRAFEKLVDTMNVLLSEMNNMSKQHDLGDIDVFVAEEKFDGAYRVMARGINDMVKGHITVKKKAMACVAEFAKGNFNAELEKFPGKKAFINENIENLRKNLKKVSSQVTKLIAASNEGRLNERADIKLFQGDWAELMRGLNGLIDAIIEPVQEAAGVLDEMSKGNLNVSVKGSYKGDHAKIKDALNDTIETLASYVGEISSTLTEMAKGNMVVSINKEYRGDFQDIKSSLNNIISSFNEVLNDINNAASQVSSGAKQISYSAQALSQGATEQASSVEELTASMEQISAQTTQNAANANQANELALSAKEDAVKGNEHMKEMLKAMDNINESSGNISKIIKVIDEIAFQTNILALNAAVEAARAGQHGKGFAVVAEEVRNLAARSANAAKETTDLIEGSINKVEFGTRIANETAAALNDIVDGVSKAADLVGEIAVASGEQASGIDQVNRAIMQVSDITQSNSATSQESAAASEELSSQAEILNGMVGRFVLKRGVYSSNNDIQGLNPSLLKKTEGISEKVKVGQASSNDHKGIALSDLEFGKY